MSVSYNYIKEVLYMIVFYKKTKEYFFGLFFEMLN